MCTHAHAGAMQHSCRGPRTRSRIGSFCFKPCGSGEWKLVSWAPQQATLTASLLIVVNWADGWFYVFLYVSTVHKAYFWLLSKVICQLHKIHMLQKYAVCVHYLLHLPSRLPSLCGIVLILFFFGFSRQALFLCAALEPVLELTL